MIKLSSSATSQCPPIQNPNPIAVVWSGTTASHGWQPNHAPC